MQAKRCMQHESLVEWGCAGQRDFEDAEVHKECMGVRVCAMCRVMVNVTGGGQRLEKQFSNEPSII